MQFPPRFFFARILKYRIVTFMLQGEHYYDATLSTRKRYNKKKILRKINAAPEEITLPFYKWQAAFSLLLIIQPSCSQYQKLFLSRFSLSFSPYFATDDCNKDGRTDYYSFRARHVQELFSIQKAQPKEKARERKRKKGREREKLDSLSLARHTHSGYCSPLCTSIG